MCILDRKVIMSHKMTGDYGDLPKPFFVFLLFLLFLFLTYGGL
jgi:hypothetical protein